MWMRVLAAVAVVVSAGVHLKLWFDGFRDFHVVGPAFMFNAIAGVVIAVLLVLWRHWIPLFLAAGFGASTLGAFILATTVGLFGLHESWSGVWVFTAAISEVVAILAGVVGLLREHPMLSRHQLEDRSSAHGAHLN